MPHGNGYGKAFLMNTKGKSQTFNERYRPTKAYVGAYIERDLKELAEARAVALNISMTQLITQAIEELLSEK
jgi:hypothetical protein